MHGYPRFNTVFTKKGSIFSEKLYKIAKRLGEYLVNQGFFSGSDEK